MRRARVVWLVALLAIAGVGPGSAQGDWSDGFEAGGSGVPAGWFVPTPGFEAGAVEEAPHAGTRCARLRSGTGAPEGFGNLMRGVSAEAYRGKTVRLRAWLRVAAGAAPGRAQMWLRVDRAGGAMGFFDNMGDRPVTTGEWRLYEIAGRVDADAEGIAFGVMLIGGGAVFVDDVSVTVVESGGPEGPRVLAGRGLDNLAAATRLLGYVRHFHPADEAAGADWDELAPALARAAEPAGSPEELAKALSAFMAPLAPSVVVQPTVGAARPEPTPKPEGAADLRVRRWRHAGVGLTPVAAAIYSSERTAESAGATPTPGEPEPGEPQRFDLEGGVTAWVPLAVWADAGGTLPRGARSATPADEPVSTTRSGDDRAVRLGDVMLAWNVFQHFYPYFDVVQTDWPAALRTALSSAANDADARAFLGTLRLLVAALHDGHGNVSHLSDGGLGLLPVAWEWIEDRLVVVASGAPELPVGTVIESVDGRPAAEALAAVERFVSAPTPQWRRVRGLQMLRAGPMGGTVVLEATDAAGARRTVKPAYAMAMAPLVEPRPEKIAELKPGVWYLDLDRLQPGDLDAYGAKLSQATGLVCDLRGYPGTDEPWKVLTHLTDVPAQSPQWHVPYVTRPDRVGMTFLSSSWPVQPLAPRWRARVAFLTDGRAISAAETYLGIVERFRMGEIVGGPTAGTNGNINPFSLPGGYAVVWTGMKVLRHDGSPHHGVGIRPTIPVSRTLAGVRAGVDEVLQKGLEAVSGS